METTKYPNDSEKNQRYLRAKKRTEALRKFYKHLIVYVVVNLVISGFKIKGYMEGGDSFEEALVLLDTWIVWAVWGVFVVLQAVRTFKSNVILGADWEEKKIREYMNENNR
jgi:hypothetical protein